MGLVLPKGGTMQSSQLTEEIKRKIGALGHAPRRRRAADWGERTHRLADALELALTDPEVTRFEQLMARIDAQIAPQTAALRRSVLRAFVKSSRNIETSETWLLETAQHVLDDCAEVKAGEPK